MGGTGSRAWYHRNSKPLVEDGLTLDMNVLFRKRLIGPLGCTGTLTWRKVPNGEYLASIGYQVVYSEPDSMGLELSYTVGRGETKHPVRETIRLHTTKQHFGGRRWWFTCPGCGRRAAKLYTRQGADLFLCRMCHGLSYTSQRENPMLRAMSRVEKIKAYFGAKQDPASVTFCYKPKGMHWRTYWRLRIKALGYEERVNMLMIRQLRQYLY